MKKFAKRFIYGLIIIFFTTIFLVGVSLAYSERVDPYYTEDSLGGLFFFFLLFAFLFKGKIMRIIATGWCLVIPLGILFMFLEVKSPIQNYAAIANENNIDLIKYDKIYPIHSEKVKAIEQNGPTKLENGKYKYIERYFYSPNIGIIMGKWEGDESIVIRDKLLNYRGAFGVITACEMFVFFSINLIPLLTLYGLFCHWKSSPQTSSEKIMVVDALILFVPVIIGSVPLFSAP
jgi:hypothetical protein